MPVRRNGTIQAGHSTRFSSRYGRVAAAVGAASAALLLAACGSSSGTGGSGAASTPSVTPGAVLGTASTSAGTVLVDSHGMTVYVFAADSPGHSNCTGSCLAYWPPVVAPATLPTPGSGMTAKIGVLKRSDGTRQLTVNGWPVYTYTGDTSPGSTAGQGTNLSGGLWWVVSPSGAQITSTGATSPSPSPSSTTSTSGGGGWA